MRRIQNLIVSKELWMFVSKGLNNTFEHVDAALA